MMMTKLHLKILDMDFANQFEHFVSSKFAVNYVYSLC